MTYNVDHSRVRSAICAIEDAAVDIKAARGDQEAVFDAYEAFEKALGRRLGNVGLNADFVNSAYRLSPLPPQGTTYRPGRPSAYKGMLYLFSEDERGQYSVLRMADDDDEGDIEDEPVCEGNVENGTLVKALRKLL